MGSGSTLRETSAKGAAIFPSRLRATTLKVGGARSFPPLAKRVAGRADSGEARAGWGVLPRGASSTIARRCRWLPWPNRRIIFVALSPRPTTPHPYPSPPLGFAEREEGGARSRHV